MLSSDKEELKTVFKEFYDNLLFMENSEEYSIGKFLGITQTRKYKIVLLIKVIIYSYLVFSFIFLPLLKVDDYPLDNSLLLFYAILQILSDNFFGYSLSRYALNRKRFKIYQKQLNLIFNNSNINHYFNENENLRRNFEVIDQKINYILKVLKTPLDYFKTYQVIGILSLIIPILIILFQNIVLSINITLLLTNGGTLVIVLGLLYTFPKMKIWRLKEFKGIRDKLDESLSNLRKIQLRNLIAT